jgi:hypothetical protein
MKTIEKPKEFKAVTRNGLPAFTKEQMAKGGGRRKGRSVKLMHEALADGIAENARREPSKRRTKQELLAAAGYLGTVGKQKAEVWSTKGLQEALAKRGFTNDKMSKVLAEAAEAKVVTVYRGEATETEAPDHAIRLRAVDQLSDVMGLKKMNLQTVNIDVNMQGEDVLGMLGF